MRRALCLLLLTGCTNPDEILPVRGSVTGTDPVDGQVVRLLRRYQEYGQSQCQSQLATPFKETQADAQGNFGFDLYRIEAESFGGFGSYCFRADATFPSGSVAWTDFNHITIGTLLPRLPDWRASPRMEGDVLRFEPPVPWPDESPPAPGEFRTSLSHRAQLTTLDGGIVWRKGDQRATFGAPTRESIVLDAVRLEDFSSVVTVEASLYEPEERAYGFGLTYGAPVGMRSGDQLPLIGARVPMSRGLACPPFGSPCPLTDGDLTVVDGGFAEDVVLELAAAGPVSTVVLRGAEVLGAFFDLSLLQEDGGVALARHPQLDREVFEMGSSFQPPVQLPDGTYAFLVRHYLVIDVDAGVPVQQVKLHFPNGLWSIQEISLFE